VAEAFSGDSQLAKLFDPKRNGTASTPPSSGLEPTRRRRLRVSERT
jgi:hypothetical protein